MSLFAVLTGLGSVSCPAAVPVHRQFRGQCFRAMQQNGLEQAVLSRLLQFFMWATPVPTSWSVWCPPPHQSLKVDSDMYSMVLLDVVKKVTGVAGDGRPQVKCTFSVVSPAQFVFYFCGDDRGRSLGPQSWPLWAAAKKVCRCHTVRGVPFWFDGTRCCWFPVWSCVRPCRGSTGVNFAEVLFPCVSL